MWISIYDNVEQLSGKITLLSGLTFFFLRQIFFYSFSGWQEAVGKQSFPGDKWDHKRKSLFLFVKEGKQAARCCKTAKHKFRANFYLVI